MLDTIMVTLPRNLTSNVVICLDQITREMHINRDCLQTVSKISLKHLNVQAKKSHDMILNLLASSF